MVALRGGDFLTLCDLPAVLRVDYLEPQSLAVKDRSIRERNLNRKDSKVSFLMLFVSGSFMLEASEMVEIKKYYLPPTKLIPNSPRPLLHYKGVLKGDACTPAGVHELFDANDWRAQWLVRYGPTQASHYHTEIHECMAVLSGTATIRWGVADLTDDLDKSTWGGMHEKGGIDIEARAGDVFVIPAGVSHKTHNTTPGGSLELLSPGHGRGIEATNGNVKDTLKKIELAGFTMMGAYPKNCGTWDFAIGVEDKSQFERSWRVPRPDRDPVLGKSSEGICGAWNESETSREHDPFASKL